MSIINLKEDCSLYKYIRYKVFDIDTNSFTEIEITPSEYGGFDLLYFGLDHYHEDFNELEFTINDRFKIIELIQSVKF